MLTVIGGVTDIILVRIKQQWVYIRLTIFTTKNTEILPFPTLQQSKESENMP